jgi:predicted DNA-binding ribbon-helix-helix protein
MAAAQNLPLTAVIRSIDEAREAPNLSSAVRIAVLRWYQSRAGDNV